MKSSFIAPISSTSKSDSIYGFVSSDIDSVSVEASVENLWVNAITRKILKPDFEKTILTDQIIKSFIEAYPDEAVSKEVKASLYQALDTLKNERQNFNRKDRVVLSSFPYMSVSISVITEKYMFSSKEVLAQKCEDILTTLVDYNKYKEVLQKTIDLIKKELKIEEYTPLAITFKQNQKSIDLAFFKHQCESREIEYFEKNQKNDTLLLDKLKLLIKDILKSPQEINTLTLNANICELYNREILPASFDFPVFVPLQLNSIHNTKEEFFHFKAYLSQNENGIATLNKELIPTDLSQEPVFLSERAVENYVNQHVNLNAYFQIEKGMITALKPAPHADKYTAQEIVEFNIVMEKQKLQAHIQKDAQSDIEAQWSKPFKI